MCNSSILHLASAQPPKRTRVHVMKLGIRSDACGVRPTTWRKPKGRGRIDNGTGIDLKGRRLRPAPPSHLRALHKSRGWDIEIPSRAKVGSSCPEGPGHARGAEAARLQRPSGQTPEAKRPESVDTLSRHLLRCLAGGSADLLLLLSPLLPIPPAPAGGIVRSGSLVTLLYSLLAPVGGYRSTFSYVCSS